MKPNTRFLNCILLVVFAIFLVTPVMAAVVDTNLAGAAELLGTNTPPAGGESSGGTWDNIKAALPLILVVVCPLIVSFIRKLPEWLSAKFKIPTNWLPWLCVGVAVLLTLITDLAGRVKVPFWILGPLIGAIGIGGRELLTRGLAILSGQHNPPPPGEATKAVIEDGPAVDK